ncbi:MAG TPA: glycoside hydrolase family 2 TIM barrel-domain containing protein [Candidatus Limnocylindrales bacterium]|nr:glycoside hydrolase family 2 TIM barrel-domain containing protein [Candidatus Limnocylindrales bacterium]
MAHRRVGPVVVAALLLGGCLPNGAIGTLAPTLTISEAGGVAVAMQNGAPVPSFGWQPRPRLDLDGRWRVELDELDVALTMGDRDATLAAIEDEAGGRHLPGFDDASWRSIDVPGTTNPPLEGVEGGAWYRTTLEVPVDWAGRATSLRFGSANYVADVWLNGSWLGYHEGGTTPFAFDVGETLQPGQPNVLAVRVHTIPLGTRSDILPWGLIDWWNYGGLTGSVWLEAAPATNIVRADVTPHLDAVDVTILLAQPERLAGIPAGPAGEREGSRGTLLARIFPATVTDENLLDPDPRALVPDVTAPLVVVEQELEMPVPGSVAEAGLTVQFGEADLWSPSRPALYVLHLETRWNDRPLDAREARATDAYWTTFGIRHIQVDPIRPRVLLNGEAVFFRGVGLHAESLRFDASGRLLHGTRHQTPEQVLGKLRDARRIGADFIRAGHEPADPTMLMLADRLGFAVWEEIPLYHATPAIFDRTMRRGIPQQMLREMALRDMNHPSVLFHGLANESTGGDERTMALSELHEVDRQIDGTRLTGQAAYAWDPADPTHAPLDVAGFTFYYGVFYGDSIGPDTRRALREANATHPGKPIVVLEFGRWADTAWDEARQALVFEETYGALERYRADRPSGFVSVANWWTLHDFATQITGIEVEDFGLMRPDGTLRAAGELAMEAFDTEGGQGLELAIEPELERPRVRPQREIGDGALVGYLLYGMGVSIGAMSLALLIVTRRGGRATGRRRR